MSVGKQWQRDMLRNNKTTVEQKRANATECARRIGCWRKIRIFQATKTRKRRIREDGIGLSACESECRIGGKSNWNSNPWHLLMAFSQWNCIITFSHLSHKCVCALLSKKFQHFSSRATKSIAANSARLVGAVPQMLCCCLCIGCASAVNMVIEHCGSAECIERAQAQQQNCCQKWQQRQH